MKLGLIGAGRIANRVSKTLAQIPELELYAVAARDINKAKAFASEFVYSRAYGSYQELYNDPEVELVYICLPHTFHYPNIVAALNAGKNVICEKPITVNAKEAEAAASLAKEKGFYLAEAMWTRYMPSRQIIADVLDSGIVGKPCMISAHLSYDITFKPRIMQKELAGGALLDLGVYGLNFCLMNFGDDIKRIDSSVKFASTGIDESESITLHYSDGKMAVVICSVDCAGGREGIIHCEKGQIVIDNINCPTRMDVFGPDETFIMHKDFPLRVSGYEYEFEEAVKLIGAGKIESDSMPLEESIKVMKLCDSIRDSWSE